MSSFDPRRYYAAAKGEIPNICIHDLDQDLLARIEQAAADQNFEEMKTLFSYRRPLLVGRLEAKIAFDAGIDIDKVIDHAVSASQDQADRYWGGEVF